MKHLSKLWVRIIITIGASTIIAESLNFIVGKSNQLQVDRNHFIGMASGIALFMILTSIVKKNKYNKN